MALPLPPKLPFGSVTAGQWGPGRATMTTMAATPQGAADGALAGMETWQASAERMVTDDVGGRVVWHCWGRGRPVVLLHGGAGSWRHWIRNLPVLASRYRVVAPDMPGLGESDLPPVPWSPEVSGGIIAAGLGHVIGPAARFDLVGFSAGAIVAGLVARLSMERCRKLVLVGAGALGTQRTQISLEKVRAKQGEARRQAHLANLGRLMFADPAKIDAQALAIQEWNTVHTRVSSVEFAETSILREALAETPAALYAIWGAQDAVARTSLAQRCEALRATRSDVDIRIVAHAGHWVAYEAADSFNATLVAMLDGEPAAGSLIS